ncbi:MAG: hypothetical protein ACKVZH_14000, partial [Blastocatellia bacterium]
LNQTRRLVGATSTGVYDDGELETLLNGTADCAPSQIRGTQALSPELLAQILAGDFGSTNVGNDGKRSNLNA